MDDLHIAVDVEFGDPGSSFVLAFRRTRTGLRDSPEHQFVLTKAMNSKAMNSKAMNSIKIGYQGATKEKPQRHSKEFATELSKTQFLFSSFDREITLRINGELVFKLQEEKGQQLSLIHI